VFALGMTLQASLTKRVKGAGKTHVLGMLTHIRPNINLWQTLRGQQPPAALRGAFGGPLGGSGGLPWTPGGEPHLTLGCWCGGRITHSAPAAYCHYNPGPDHFCVAFTGNLNPSTYIPLASGYLISVSHL